MYFLIERHCHAGFVSGVMALSLDLSIFNIASPSTPEQVDIRIEDIRLFDEASERSEESHSLSASPVAPQRDASTPAPTMDEMKQAFDQVAEDGVVCPSLLQHVLQRRNPQATEADALSLIEMMRPNEDEDASFSGFVKGVAALSLDMRIFVGEGESGGEFQEMSSRASDSTLSSVQRGASTPAPTMDEMKRAFDQVAEDGVVVAALLLVVLQRRNPQATEADAMSLIEMMRPNEDEDASFSGFVAAVAALSLDMRFFLEATVAETANADLIATRRARQDSGSLQYTDGAYEQPDLEDMKSAFDAVATGGILDEEKLLSIMRHRKPNVAESDVSDLIQVMAKNGEEDVHFAGTPPPLDHPPPSPPSPPSSRERACTIIHPVQSSLMASL
jgi:Ca2+-binding EF-hand superfamily protein